MQTAELKVNNPANLVEVHEALVSRFGKAPGEKVNRFYLDIVWCGYEFIRSHTPLNIFYRNLAKLNDVGVHVKYLKSCEERN